MPETVTTIDNHVIDLKDLKYYDGRRRTEITKEITDATKDKVDKVAGKGLSTNDLTDELLAKVNASGTSNFSGSYNDLTDKPVDATASKAGFMSADDKQKLDAIEEGANKYIHPAHTAVASGLNKLTVDELGHVTASIPVVKADITALGIPAQDTTYTAATQTKDGLLAADDKAKLDGIAAGAQANVIEIVKVNGAALTPSAKAVDIAVPTKVSQITNDSKFQTEDEVEATVTGKGYQTAAQVETAITGKGYQTAQQVSTAVNTAISGLKTFGTEFVDELPATGDAKTMYFVPKTGGVSGNTYTEYMWNDAAKAFEKVGDTEIDLSGYMKKTDIEFASFADIDTIFAAE